MKTRRETFAYIGLAIIIVELMFLAGIYAMRTYAASVASLATAIDIEEPAPVEETAAVYHLEADAPTWNTLTNNPKLADMPTEASEATAEAPAIYKDIVVSEDDGGLLEAILWAEANNQCFEGQKAVIEVIFNRVLSDEWPDTIYDVLSQKGQFATWKSRNKVKPTEVQSDVISDVLRETETVLPDTTYVYFDRRGKNGKAHVRIQDHVFGR